MRRFSQNGLQFHKVMQALYARADEPVFMASCHGETTALEAFLESFPVPSPARFQTSVHPSGVQQGRVGCSAPLGVFMPLVGGDLLGFQACRAALSSGAPDLLLVGGDEKGGWLTEIGLASDVGFAFGLRLSQEDTKDGLGAVSWVPAADEASSSSMTLFDLFEAVRGLTPVEWSHPDLGSLRIDWR